MKWNQRTAEEKCKVLANRTLLKVRRWKTYFPVSKIKSLHMSDIPDVHTKQSTSSIQVWYQILQIKNSKHFRLGGGVTDPGGVQGTCGRCVEGHGLMRIIGDGRMAGLDDPVGLFQPWWFYDLHCAKWREWRLLLLTCQQWNSVGGGGGGGWN